MKNQKEELKVLDFLNPTRLQILYYLAKNPEGKQKSEIANKLPLSRNASLKIQKELFDEKLIEPKPDFDRHRFSLSLDGLNVIYLLNAIEIYIKKAKDPEYFASEEEIEIFNQITKISQDFIKQQKALRTAKKVENL